ncbi:SRPBCC domain-containing protein [Oceanobacillus profundus]|uniref:SRPBCC family protein n=1 Tax=Oceanobacillus TaxID=182709 RepID=UPI00203C20AC|nr:SRPBCC domain-containing protein [Oceanobacillus profundus]MCM3397808.1 SRPBCC domain-containing protein [Oceanobacillus profundus]MDO6448962.1 SRPBCC domain-containing protein [Oceanobacillus profundus]
MNSDTSSILIDADREKVWDAITNDEKFSVWYAPGSKWSIPKLEVGEKAAFTLMPSKHNNLKDGESIPMSFEIKEVIPNQVFSFSSKEDDIFFSYKLSIQSGKTQVTLNMEGFDHSLENLKAFVEGKELPYS